MKNQLRLSYLGFITLGVSTGLLGVAWTSIRNTFDLSLDAVGILLVAGTMGYLTAGFLSGRLLSRFQAGHYILAGFIFATIGLFGQAFTPNWPLLVLFTLIGGFGTGVIDAGLNIYTATHFGARQINWLHASFGVGATIAPLLITAVINSELSWRIGYLLTAIFYALVTIPFYLSRQQWHMNDDDDTETTTPTERVSYRRTLKLPIVWLGIFVFFFYTGIEVSAGQWAFPLFNESRGISAEIAGIWVSIYWGSLTVGRLLSGAVAEQLGTRRLLQGSMVGALVGAILLSLPIPWLGFVGLALIGLAEAPIFPTLTAETPARVGKEHGANAIGFQMATAGVGSAILPSLAGLLADSINLEIIGPFIAVSALAMFLLYQRMQ